MVHNFMLKISLTHLGTELCDVCLPWKPVQSDAIPTQRARFGAKRFDETFHLGPPRRPTVRTRQLAFGARAREEDPRERAVDQGMGPAVAHPVELFHRWLLDSLWVELDAGRHNGGGPTADVATVRRPVLQ